MAYGNSTFHKQRISDCVTCSSHCINHKAYIHKKQRSFHINDCQTYANILIISMHDASSFNIFFNFHRECGWEMLEYREHVNESHILDIKTFTRMPQNTMHAAMWPHSDSKSLKDFNEYNELALMKWLIVFQWNDEWWFVFIK